MKSGVIHHGGRLVYYEVDGGVIKRAVNVGDGPAERTAELAAAIESDIKHQEGKE